MQQPYYTMEILSTDTVEWAHTRYTFSGPAHWMDRFNELQVPLRESRLTDICAAVKSAPEGVVLICPTQ